MEIEYIYPDNNDNRDPRRNRNDALSGLVTILFLLIGIYLFFILLPIFIIILGWAIVFLALYIVYKSYLEIPILKLIQKIKQHQRF